MAENKKSFLLYTDIHFTLKRLTDEQAGKLFKIILAYVNDENPESDDPLIAIAFEPIKQSLKRDLRKYEIIREKRILAGKASANKRQQVSTSVEQDEHMLTHSTVNDSVSVSDNVNDNGSVIKNRRRKPFQKPTIQEVRNFFEENGYDPDFGETRWHYYNDANWFDSHGSPVLNWKQKMRSVWFKDEHKKKTLKLQM